MERNISISTLETAWKLVCPAATMARLVAEHDAPAAALAAVTWRDEISALVTCHELLAAGVTADDIAAAVEHYTATVATISKEVIGTRNGGATPGVWVRAAGYRKGPAGP